MKKISLAFVTLFIVLLSAAQVSVPTGVDAKVPSLQDFVKPPSIGDVTKTTTGIVDKLMGDLKLPSAQKPKLTDAIAPFLKSKKDILGLAGTNPADYLKKFNPLQSGLFSKLKGIMGASAFTKFLGLKPSGSNVAGNLLSNLFF